METTLLTVRSMRISDVEYGLQLSTTEGWNQTKKDWNFLIENPQNVCLVAEADGKVIGTTTAINYSNEIAWIGMVLVDKEYRGRGASKLLLTNILKKLGSCKSVKLDATAAGREVYKKFGFEDEYLITRMINGSPTVPEIEEDESILPEPVQLTHINEIAALDKIIFGAGRIPLIEYLVKEYPKRAWLLKRNNKVDGFVLGREGNKYQHIGPLVSSTIADVKILISKTLKELNSRPVVADIPFNQKDLINWLNEIGFVKQRDFIRMYLKRNIPLEKIYDQYLICGPEFG